MCKPSASNLLKSKGGVICCMPGVNQDKSFCNREENVCGDTFNESMDKWWLQCPQATPQNCGGQRVIQAYEETQKWGKAGMRYNEATSTQWKTPKEQKADMCWWLITTENAKWRSANINIKFTKKDAGVTLLAYGVEKPPNGEVPGDNDHPKMLIKLFDANN